MSRIEITDESCNLEPGEWAYAIPGEFLETGGAAPCAIVAVINHSKQRAWMVHQQPPYMTDDDLGEMLADAHHPHEPADNMEIFVGGCVGKECEASRKRVREMLAETFPDHPVTDWWGVDGILLRPDGSSWKAQQLPA